MRARYVWTVVVLLLVSVLGVGRPASAEMEKTTLKFKVGNVLFRMHQVCIGINPRTGLFHVVEEMELTPAPAAAKWVAHLDAEGPTEDAAHAFAAVAGVALFFGQTSRGILAAVGPGFMLDVKRLKIWQGPVSASQVMGFLQGALQLFNATETKGVLADFNRLSAALKLPPGPICTVPAETTPW